jgi:uncharacterized protein
MSLRGVGLSLCLLLLPCEAAAQSFDCTKAGTQAEELVCSDADLGALDEWLSAVFDIALRSFPEEEVPTLRAYQRGWIKGRDDCWKAADARSCVEYAYRSRIAELQIQTGRVIASSRGDYTCDGTDTPFVAVFFEETVPEAVVLTYGNGQVIAFRAEPEGTAKWYGGPGVEFEETAGTASVNWFGEQLRCTRR